MYFQDLDWIALVRAGRVWYQLDEADRAVLINPDPKRNALSAPLAARIRTLGGRVSEEGGLSQDLRLWCRFLRFVRRQKRLDLKSTASTEQYFRRHWKRRETLALTSYGDDPMDRLTAGEAVRSHRWVESFLRAHDPARWETTRNHHRQAWIFGRPGVFKAVSLLLGEIRRSGGQAQWSRLHFWLVDFEDTLFAQTLFGALYYGLILVDAPDSNGDLRLRLAAKARKPPVKLATLEPTQVFQRALGVEDSVVLAGRLVESDLRVDEDSPKRPPDPRLLASSLDPIPHWVHQGLGLDGVERVQGAWRWLHSLGAITTREQELPPLKNSLVPRILAGSNRESPQGRSSAEWEADSADSRLSPLPHHHEVSRPPSRERVFRLTQRGHRWMRSSASQRREWTHRRMQSLMTPQEVSPGSVEPAFRTEFPLASEPLPVRYLGGEPWEVYLIRRFTEREKRWLPLDEFIAQEAEHSNPLLGLTQRDECLSWACPEWDDQRLVDIWLWQLKTFFVDRLLATGKVKLGNHNRGLLFQLN